MEVLRSWFSTVDVFPREEAIDGTTSVAKPSASSINKSFEEIINTPWEVSLDEFTNMANNILDIIRKSISADYKLMALRKIALWSKNKTYVQYLLDETNDLGIACIVVLENVFTLFGIETLQYEFSILALYSWLENHDLRVSIKSSFSLLNHIMIDVFIFFSWIDRLDADC